jgi:3-isopropylmalate/(R)-2-methylmalate dehydratase large subunit
MSYVESALRARAGDFVDVPVDLLMGHDGTASLVVDRFRAEKLSIWDASKVLLVFDHFAPPATIERADIQNKLLAFAREYRLPVELFQGICHQLLIEHPKVVPGAVVIGADSHTTTAGCLGALATGVGATDFLNVLSSGRIWLRVPKTIRVVLRGSLPEHIDGKDIALELLRLLGPDGALYKCIEFHDRTTPPLTLDYRATLCNLAVDLGAKFGIFIPDEVTSAALKRNGAETTVLPFDIEDRDCEKLIELDVSRLSPLLLAPDGRVEPVAAHAGRPVTQVFIGSCTAGRLSDLRAAAEIFGRHPGKLQIKCIVIPGSAAVAVEAMAAGYIQTCVRIGAAVGNPSCGPCCNIDKGVVGNNEVCLSTSNRNFRGRMGAASAEVYLVSSRTAAVSAIHGVVTDPQRTI